MRTARSLLMALALCCTAFAEDFNRLDPTVAPVLQSVELRLDPNDQAFSGRTRIELEVTRRAASFRFHALELDLKRFVLHGAEGPIATRLEEAGPEGMQRAVPARPLAPGSYALEIAFSGHYNQQMVGLYQVEHGEEKYLFTQFQVADARRAFPCWDEPAYKIPFQLTLEVPEEQVAISNTPVEKRSAEGGWKTVSFRRTQPMPSYLVALAVGPLKSVPIDGLSVPGRIYTVSGQSHLAAEAAVATPPLLEAMEAYFDRPYPYAKLDLVAVPEFVFGAMENVGLITFRDEILLVDPQGAGVAQKSYMVEVIAHELAHMWFGNLVSLAWWDDMWLNESFASWLGDKVAHQVFPHYRIDLQLAQDELMMVDARPSTLPVRRPVNTTAEVEEDIDLAYGKGQTVLGMVEQWLGPEVFRQGVVTYMENHAWANAQAADLWSALAGAAGREVAPVMASFLDQPGVPLLKAEPSGRTLHLSQRRLLNPGVEAPAQLWALPLRLRWTAGGPPRIDSFLLDGESAALDLGAEPEWVFPDAGAFGYYRWQVPEPMLLDMAGRAGRVLEPRERIAFLGNAEALLDAGAIGGSTYLAVLEAFAEDAEPQVVARILLGVEKVRLTFADEEGDEHFAAWVRRLLSPALERFAPQVREGEDEAVSLLRPDLLLALGHRGRDPQVRQRAQAMVQVYLDTPSAIDPSLAGAALQVAALEGDSELFETYRQRFEEASTPAARKDLLEGLGAFADPALREQALAYALEGPLRPMEIFAVVKSVNETEAGRQSVSRWLRAGYGDLAGRLPGFWMAFMPYVAAEGCSAERLEAARAFFAEPPHQVPGTLNNLEKVADQVEDCLHLRQREGESVRAHLRAAR